MKAPHDKRTRPTLPSRLPAVGRTIFRFLSALAAGKGALNPGQGCPDFDCDAPALPPSRHAMRQGRTHNPPSACV
ncbi:methionine aminotransferase, partial [Burkholderia pseudomallei]